MEAAGAGGSGRKYVQRRHIPSRPYSRALCPAGAYVNLNDPDWAAWVTVWTLPAWVCSLAFWHGTASLPAVSVAALALLVAGASVARGAAAGWAAHGLTFSSLAHVEECREATGLAIMAAWLGFLAAVGGRGRAGGGAVPAAVVTAVATGTSAGLAWAWYRWMSLLAAGQLTDLPEHCNGTFDF